MVKESIKFGFGFYIGWTAAKVIDRALGKFLTKDKKEEESTN